MKKLLLKIIVGGTFFLSIFTFNGQAQQDPLYTQYLFNQLTFNPAYAGIYDFASATLIHRNQWVGFNGRPKTLSFSAQSSLVDNKIGAGILINDDRWGVYRNTEVTTSYSYNLPVSVNGRISMGLQASLLNYRVSFAGINFKTKGDPNFAGGERSILKPNFGTGFMYRGKYGFAGFSIPRLLNVNFEDNGATFTRYSRHYYFTGGYLLEIRRDLQIKPSFLLKTASGVPMSLDFNVSAFINEIVWAGISYRNPDMFGINGQVQLMDHLRVGYAYEFLPNINVSTHEFMLTFDAPIFDYQKMESRYF